MGADWGSVGTLSGGSLRSSAPPVADRLLGGEQNRCCQLDHVDPSTILWIHFNGSAIFAKGMPNRTLIVILLWLYLWKQKWKKVKALKKELWKHFPTILGFNSRDITNLTPCEWEFHCSLKPSRCLTAVCLKRLFASLAWGTVQEVVAVQIFSSSDLF